MRQRTMIIVLALLIVILIILWWLTLQRPIIQPPITVSPTPTSLPTTTPPGIVPTASPSLSPAPTATPTSTLSPTATASPTSTFTPQPTVSPTGPTISPTAVPFASPPGLVIPTGSPTSIPSPTVSPTAEAIPPTISITPTAPAATPAKVAELVIDPSSLPGSLKYQYRYKGETQKFSFEDDNLIIAFPTSIPNRFRLVTTSTEDSFEIIKIYDKTVTDGENIDIWSSPVFYMYVGMYNGKIILFGGSNDASPQDILSHDVQTGESKLLANDVGNVTRIIGNTITYQAFVEIPFNDENPDQEMPVGEEKTITLN